MEDQPELHQKWQQIRKHPVASVLIALFFTLVVLVIFILGGYKFNWGWTGFNQPSKTLWDWLQLLGVLAVPVVVGFGAVWFTTRQGKVADAENTDNQREAVLQAYLDKMSELLLANHLRDSAEDQEARQIARARTYTALSRLDGVRKRSALQFLYEAHLINIFDWSYADLSKAALSEATLCGANLSRAKLSGANLSVADLTDAKFTGADITGADLSGADLTGADLSGADLTDTSLSGASLSGASLSGAYLGGANLSKIMHWHTVTTTQRQLYRNLKRGSRLRKQVLRVSEKWKNPLSIFLDESTMTVTFKNGTNLSGANLSGADLSGADLSDANLEGASLKKADLFTTNLTRANLKDANLTEAKMSRAKLTVVVRTQMFLNATSSTAYLEWADLEKGYPVPGEKGQLLLSPTEAKKLLEKLEKSDGNKAYLGLKTVRSKVVKLEAADLQEADLTGAVLSRANLSRANLSYANLSRADLSGADLSNAILFNAILFNADLSNAILEGTNFNKAWVTKEQLEKAKSLKGATMPDGSIHP